MRAQSNHVIAEANQLIREHYVGIRGAADYSGKSPTTLRRAVKAGELRAYRCGVGLPQYHRLTFRLADLDRWLQREPAVAATRAVVDEIVAKVTGERA